MMNDENKVMNALVNLMVCPRNPGSACCVKCAYSGSDGCYEHLISDSMISLHANFGIKAPASVKPAVAAPNYERQVTDIIREIGVPFNILGHKYVRCAIVLAIGDGEYISGITKLLYPTVAKEFGTTSSRVERAIRHAVECAWDRGDLEVLQKYFGNTVSGHKGKPTNSEFIATIADYVKLANDSSSK